MEEINHNPQPRYHPSAMPGKWVQDMVLDLLLTLLSTASQIFVIDFKHQVPIHVRFLFFGFVNKKLQKFTIFFDIDFVNFLSNKYITYLFCI